MNTRYLIGLTLACTLITFTRFAPAQPSEAARASAAGEQPATSEEMQTARQALDQIVRAYEVGDLVAVRSLLDPGMIGYQRFIDGVQQDLNSLKQIRIHLLEAQVTSGPDVAAIQTTWEKRFFSVTDSQPGLLSGRTLVLMHRTPTGWRLAAIAGDNPFSRQSGTLARLNVGSPAFTRAMLAPCSIPCNLPLQIELIDPDLAGAAGVNIEVRTNQGDVETVALTAVSPGRFVRNTLTFVSLPSPSPYSGAVNINISAPPVVATFRYVDKDPGAGRPPTTLSRSLTIVP